MGAKISTGKSKKGGQKSESKSSLCSGPLFKRRSSSLFLDYNGLSFEDYHNQLRQGGVSSFKPEVHGDPKSTAGHAPGDHVRNETRKGHKGQHHHGASEDSLGQGKHGYDNSVPEDDEVENIINSGRMLKYSVERQLSESIEEAELTSSPPPYCCSQEADWDSCHGSLPTTPQQVLGDANLSSSFVFRKISDNSEASAAGGSKCLATDGHYSGAASGRQSVTSASYKCSTADTHHQPCHAAACGRQSAALTGKNKSVIQHSCSALSGRQSAKLDKSIEERQVVRQGLTYPKPDLSSREELSSKFSSRGELSSRFSSKADLGFRMSREELDSRFSYSLLLDTPVTQVQPVSETETELSQATSLDRNLDSQSEVEEGKLDNSLPDLEEALTSPSNSTSTSLDTSSSDCHVNPLGHQQVRDIRSSWVIIVEEFQKNGVSSFQQKFDSHPFLLEPFEQMREGPKRPEKDLPELVENHIKMLLNTIHEVVINLDDVTLLNHKLETLGRWHSKASVQLSHLDVMGPIFCNAIRPILLNKDIWSRDLEDSWMELLQIINEYLKRGYQDNSDNSFSLDLSPTQKCILTATWQTVFHKHVNALGAKTLMDLFQVEPVVLNYFEAFREVEVKNLPQLRAFRNHGSRLMDLIRFVVKNIENPARVHEHMLLLGRLHVKKMIPAKFLHLMGPTFCQAVRPLMMSEGIWSLEVERAWVQLMKILTNLMESAYNQQPYLSEFPSVEQTEILQTTWTSLQKNHEDIGREAFSLLFQSHADIRMYFPAMKKLSQADLLFSHHLKSHAGRVMTVISNYLEVLDSPQQFLNFLIELGEFHYKRGIRSEYLDIMGPVFCQTIRPILLREKRWTIQVEEVWLLLFKNITNSLKKGYPREKRKSSKFLKK